MGFLLLHSSRLKPSLCTEALESCRFSSRLLLEELQRGSCDSLFQLCFPWKLESITRCHPSHPLQTDPDNTATSRGRRARKNINCVSFQGLVGLHVQQNRYWAFSHRHFQRSSISVQRAGINRSLHTKSPGRLSRTIAVHRSKRALCTLLIPWEAGSSYPSCSRAQLVAANLTAVLHLGLVTQSQAQENKSDLHCKGNAAHHRHPYGIWVFPAYAHHLLPSQPLVLALPGLPRAKQSWEGISTAALLRFGTVRLLCCFAFHSIAAQKRPHTYWGNIRPNKAGDRAPVNFRGDRDLAKKGFREWGC